MVFDVAGGRCKLCILRMHIDKRPEELFFVFKINNLQRSKGVHTRYAHFPVKVCTFLNDKCDLCTPLNRASRVQKHRFSGVHQGASRSFDILDYSTKSHPLALLSRAFLASLAARLSSSICSFFFAIASAFAADKYRPMPRIDTNNPARPT